MRMRLPRTVMQRWRYSSLVALSGASAPIPRLLAELDMRSDGTLDLRRSALSGRFVSAKLEDAYNAYLFAIWLPRLKLLSAVVIVSELYAFIDSFYCCDSFYCSCGTRFGVYHGAALIFSYVFPSSVLVITLLLLSSKRMSRLGRDKAPLVLAIATVVLVAGYTQPLAAYLRSDPILAASNATWSADLMDCLRNATLASAPSEEGNADTIGRSLACVKVATETMTQNALWGLSTIVIFLLLLSLGATSLGLGPLPFALFVPIPASMYITFNYSWYLYAYSASIDLVGPAVLLGSLALVLTYVHNKSARQEFLVRIYTRNEKDRRVEQLQEEKERLDYERRFALHQASRSPELRGLSAGEVLSLDGREESEAGGARSELRSELTGVEEDAEVDAEVDVDGGSVASTSDGVELSESPGLVRFARGFEPGSISSTAGAASQPAAAALSLSDVMMSTPDTSPAMQRRTFASVTSGTSRGTSVASDPELLTALDSIVHEGGPKAQCRTHQPRPKKTAAAGAVVVSTAGAGSSSQACAPPELWHPSARAAGGDAPAAETRREDVPSSSSAAGFRAMMSVRAAATLHVPHSRALSTPGSNASDIDGKSEPASDTSTSTAPARRYTNKPRDNALAETLSALGLRFFK